MPSRRYGETLRRIARVERYAALYIRILRGAPGDLGCTLHHDPAAYQVVLVGKPAGEPAASCG